MKTKPDTIPSREWQRLQPIEWRMNLAMSFASSTITAEELDYSVDMWEALKDTGVCRFVYQGDYVDGIGEFNGGYYIYAH